MDEQELVDARGVIIEPGDTVIYGFSVGRSVAMAEGVVVTQVPEHGPATVSLTPAGRVRVRIVRRTYCSGEKPVVDVAPDRLVTLKAFGVKLPRQVYLPPSPLPTQGEEARRKIQEGIDRYTEDLRSDTITWGVTSFSSLSEFHAYAAKRITELRKKLRALDEAE